MSKPELEVEINYQFSRHFKFRFRGIHVYLPRIEIGAPNSTRASVYVCGIAL